MDKAGAFWIRVIQSGDCWEWAGTKTAGGYGAFYDGKRTVMAHRWAYEYMTAPIPQGLSLDHLCRNRACVNPYHLDPVTHSVNVNRGEAREFHKAKTHCPQNHEYTEENTYVYRGSRHCRTCQRQRDATRTPRKRRART